MTKKANDILSVGQDRPLIRQTIPHRQKSGHCWASDIHYQNRYHVPPESAFGTRSCHICTLLQVLQMYLIVEAKRHSISSFPITMKVRPGEKQEGNLSTRSKPRPCYLDHPTYLAWANCAVFWRVDQGTHELLILTLLASGLNNLRELPSTNPRHNYDCAHLRRLAISLVSCDLWSPSSVQRAMTRC